MTGRQYVAWMRGNGPRDFGLGSSIAVGGSVDEVERVALEWAGSVRWRYFHPEGTVVTVTKGARQTVVRRTEIDPPPADETRSRELV